MLCIATHIFYCLAVTSLLFLLPEKQIGEISFCLINKNYSFNNANTWNSFFKHSIKYEQIIKNLSFLCHLCKLHSYRDRFSHAVANAYYVIPADCMMDSTKPWRKSGGTVCPWDVVVLLGVEPGKNTS